jgi:hypothetical protein
MPTKKRRNRQLSRVRQRPIVAKRSPMKKPWYSSNEFFVEHPDGSRTDAELHEPILDVDGKQRRADLIRFYSIIETLKRKIGGVRKFSDCSGTMSWPKRGVYFFYENGEDRSDTGGGPRVVRVGTQAVRLRSASTFWQRLRQHKGSKSGGGNHRGSVFRLLLGEAAIRKENLDFPNWGIGNSAVKTVLQAELPLELRVSKMIGEMNFLWLPIDDEPGPKSLRSFVEQNSIGLLSNYARAVLDPQSKKWLGNYSPRARVKNSGLRNQDYVENSYAPSFLDDFDRLVSSIA